ncbi:response regulator [Aquimarina agarivorans]|uniref:response regulator n=1 Tax=Aquimarina agarivorans TaxID=980584 RepID=UPI000248EFB1|nr:response regulator [Aquimarina agarivorans]
MSPTLNLTCIIDDDAVYIKLVKKLLQLKKLCKNIIVFENGKEALEYFSQKNLQNKQLPELILLDLNMPVMNGWEFLEQYNHIKSNLEHKPSLYVVSSSIDPMDSQKAKNIDSVEDYLSKPISLKTFETICNVIAS